MAKSRQTVKIVTQPRDTPITEVWPEYKKTGSEELRNHLMEHYLPLVKYNAERIYAKLPDEVDVDDLMSAGIFGLMDAIDAFETDPHVARIFTPDLIRNYVMTKRQELHFMQEASPQEQVEIYLDTV